MSIVNLPTRDLRRTGLREQVHGYVRTAIVTGDIRPGETYTVGVLVRQLGVSATPVREALLDLASEGLVEVIPNRGFRVPELSERDLDDLFQLRLLLEGGAAELLAGSLTAEQLTELRHQATRIVGFARAGNLSEFLIEDRNFHLALLSYLGNRRLVDLVGKLRDQTRLYGLPELALRGKLESAASEHLDLLDALESTQARKVRVAFTKHLRHTRGLWAGHSE